MRRLNERLAVAGQIVPADLPALAAAGVTTIVNNRPDGEEPGQPPGAEIEAAARAAGLAYVDLPVVRTIAPEQVAAMAAVLAEAPGTVLAFCRSGARSEYLCRLALAARGEGG